MKEAVVNRADGDCLSHEEAPTEVAAVTTAPVLNSALGRTVPYTHAAPSLSVRKARLIRIRRSSNQTAYLSLPPAIINVSQYAVSGAEKHLGKLVGADLTVLPPIGFASFKTSANRQLAPQRSLSELFSSLPLPLSLILSHGCGRRKHLEEEENRSSWLSRSR